MAPSELLNELLLPRTHRRGSKEEPFSVQHIACRVFQSVFFNLRHHLTAEHRLFPHLETLVGVNTGEPGSRRVSASVHDELEDENTWQAAAPPARGVQGQQMEARGQSRRDGGGMTASYFYPHYSASAAQGKGGGRAERGLPVWRRAPEVTPALSGVANIRDRHDDSFDSGPQRSEA